MKQLTQKGATVEEAIERALLQLGTTRDKVTIEVVDKGRKGFFGFGARSAEVKVTSRELPKEETVAEERVESTRDLPVSTSEDEKKEVLELPKKEETEQRSEEESKASVSEVDVEIETETLEVTELKKQEKQEKIDDTVQVVKQYITSVAHAMDVKDVEISISFDKKYMDVQVETESAGRLIGRHGKNLRALEELAQVVARDEAETFLIVRLNIGDYLERREETLRYLANDFADRAIETDRLVKLDPMSSYERKIIHHELATRVDVETSSVGKEPYRSVTIRPLS